MLSVDELKAGEDKMRAEHLAKLDTNHDGTVSPEERKAAFEKFAQARFAKLDKNGDGALTKDEVGDKRWEHLSVADADKNGSVTQAEIRQAVASGVLKFPHRGRGGHGHHGDGDDGRSAPGRRSVGAHGSGRDLNSSSRVSSEIGWRDVEQDRGVAGRAPRRLVAFCGDKRSKCAVRTEHV